MQTWRVQVGVCRPRAGTEKVTLVDVMGMLRGDLSQDVRGAEAAAAAPPLVFAERGATAALREC